MKRLVLITIFLLTLLLSVSPVVAHGYIIRSIPEDRSKLERPRRDRGCCSSPDLASAG